MTEERKERILNRADELLRAHPEWTVEVAVWKAWLELRYASVASSGWETVLLGSKEDIVNEFKAYLGDVPARDS